MDIFNPLMNTPLSTSGYWCLSIRKNLTSRPAATLSAWGKVGCATKKKKKVQKISDPKSKIQGARSSSTQYAFYT